MKTHARKARRKIARKAEANRLRNREGWDKWYLRKLNIWSGIDLAASGASWTSWSAPAKATPLADLAELARRHKSVPMRPAVRAAFDEGWWRNLPAFCYLTGF